MFSEGDGADCCVFGITEGSFSLFSSFRFWLFCSVLSFVSLIRLVFFCVGVSSCRMGYIFGGFFLF